MAFTIAEIEQKMLAAAGTTSIGDFVTSVANDRIADEAQRSMARLAGGDDRQRLTAAVLAAAVQSNLVSAITSASAAGQALPEGSDAYFSAALGGSTVPTVVYRDEIAADDAALDRALVDSVRSARTNLAPINEPLAMAPVASISCMVYCGLCALALLDEIPFDEIYPCTICMTCATDA